VLRERLLEHALDGLFSDILRGETETGIKRWYPARHKWRSDVYSAMAEWPYKSEIGEALWRGLLDEEEQNQRAAAEAIAKNFGGEAAIGDRLLRLLLTPAEPDITAHALHALCLGWPKEPRLPQALREARQTADWTLRLIAIIHRVKRQEHDARDRESLLEFATNRYYRGWRWREDAVETLVTGWPNDREIKKTALKSIATRWADEGPMSWEFAGPILMRGFSQDDEVAAAIAVLFRHQDHPGHHLGLNVDWTPLIESFAGHPLLRDAVDDWLEKKGEERLFWNYQCCLISKSQ